LRGGKEKRIDRGRTGRRRVQPNFNHRETNKTFAGGGKIWRNEKDGSPSLSQRKFGDRKCLRDQRQQKIEHRIKKKKQKVRGGRGGEGEPILKIQKKKAGTAEGNSN